MDSHCSIGCIFYSGIQCYNCNLAEDKVSCNLHICFSYASFFLILTDIVIEHHLLSEGKVI